MRLRPEEPPAGPWQPRRWESFVAAVAAAAGAPDGRPRVVAVDGRGGSGKTVLAERLRGALPGAAVVHTDDVAWWHSRFGWDDLMLDGVLRPLHAGRDVRFQPPAWAEHGRDGHLEVPASRSFVVVEGVGASRRELAAHLDAAIWVQSDVDKARRRGLARDMLRDGTDLTAAEREWDAWDEEEIPFLAADRPWERAGFIVCGTPEADIDAASQVLAAPPLKGRAAAR